MKRGALACVFAALGLLLAVPTHAADTVYYYSSDTIHSEVVVTDQNRNVVERTHYAPYGQVLDRDLRDGPGYSGHEEDPETNLVYMQQRYYDPEAGRFLSTDPVRADGGGGSFNRYEYAEDNPYRFTDPTGMCTGTHICDGDLAVSTGAYTTGAADVPLAMQQRSAASRLSTAPSRVNQARNYLEQHEKDVSGSYSSPGNAASAFGKTFAKEFAKLGVEFGANIFSALGDNNLIYSLGDFNVTSLDDIIGSGPAAGLGAVKIAGSLGDPSYWGMVHTHWAKMGEAGNRFSWNDWQIMIERRVNGYVIFPDQTEQSFDYSKYNPQTMTPGSTYYDQEKFNF